MSDTVLSDWYQMDEETTHFCGGTTDEKKTNKADLKVTQTDMTKWFNPTESKEDSEVLTCRACGAEHQPGDPTVIIGR
jgi:hypothetical protein